MLIILLSLCFIVLVLLVGMYHIYSKNVSLNEDVTEINTKLEEMAKNTEDTNTSATLQFKTINEKIEDTLQRNIADLQTDLDVYRSTTNSNNNLLADLKEGHSNMTSDMDSVVIDLTTIESNVLENQNTFSESLADIEQAFTNKHLNLARDISSLDSKNAALERRFVEYKVSSDDSYDALEARFTELDEEIDEQNSLYATLQQKYTELDEKMDNLQNSKQRTD
jgi:predicted  nucleic acid-binding Zn-ribbon protein